MIYIEGDLAKTAGIIISDPLYDSAVKCRYQRMRMGSMQLYASGVVWTAYVDYSDDTTPLEMREALSRCKETRLCLIIGCKYEGITEKLSYIAIQDDNEFEILLSDLWQPSRNVEIGIDSARVHVGNAATTEYLNTGGDGSVGNVREYKIHGDTRIRDSATKKVVTIPGGFTGILLNATFDGDIVEETHLAEYIKREFEISV